MIPTDRPIAVGPRRAWRPPSPAHPGLPSALAARLRWRPWPWAWRPGPAIGSAPDWLYGRAQAEARAGRYERAAVYLDWLARLRSPTPYVHLLRAQVAGARGQTDAAVAELGAIPDGHDLAPLARLSEGQLEARRGRLRLAEAAFLAALRLNPKVVQARRELVYIYSVQQRLHRDRRASRRPLRDG